MHEVWWTNQFQLNKKNSQTIKGAKRKDNSNEDV